MKSLIAVLCPLVLFPASFLLTGCSALNSSDATPSQTSVGTIQGNVHGGQQAVVGAKVYLFTNGVTAYGGNGITASSSGPSSNASISLLNSSGSNTVSDGTNYYVLTGAGGAFTITGDYTCTTGTQLYLYAVGGNAGSGTNANAGFLAGLGSCPISSSSYIVMNELTTVVTAYALAGFATDATHISTSGSTLAGTGIANAMANVTNMVALSTGTLYTTTHATGSTATVPQNLINTLADILAACVNSNGSSSTGCTTLFNNAKSAGSTGTTATDTATAAINIAHNPTSNIAALYGNPTPSTPFTPPLSAQPSDFTLGLSFTGGGFTAADLFPRELAVDASGNIWAVSGGSSSVLSEFSSLGAPVSSTGYAATPAMVQANSVAVDNGGASASVYVASFANTGASEISKFTASSGAFVSNYSVGTGAGPGDIAIDGNGNIWTSDYNVNNVSKHAGTGTVAAANYTPSSGTMGAPQSLAIAAGTSGSVYISDYNDGNAWVFTNAGSGSLASSSAGGSLGGSAVAVDSNGAAWFSNYQSVNKLSGSTLTASAIGYYDNGIAIDGGNNAWVANENSNTTTGEIYQFNTSDVLINGSAGYALSPQGSPASIVVDGSGNIWYTVFNNATIRELIGVAVPVATPLAYGTANNMLGTRP